MSLIIKGLYLGSYNEARKRDLLIKKKIKGIVITANH